MLKIENFEEFNVVRAVYSARNALNSWDKSDSDFDNNTVGANDLDLAKRLYKAGSEHRKYLRQIFISMDITAPLYFWSQFDTYKVGTTANSCSKMHTLHKRDLTLDDFSTEHLNHVGSKSVLQDVIDCINLHRQVYVDTKAKENWYTMIQLLPSSFNQRRTVTMNLENAVNIINQRSHHKLDEWHVLCDFLKENTFLKNLI